MGSECKNSGLLDALSCSLGNLMFGSLDAQKIHIFAARACSMLDFDAKIPFLWSKKRFFLGSE